MLPAFMMLRSARVGSAGLARGIGFGAVRSLVGLEADVRRLRRSRSSVVRTPMLILRPRARRRRSG